MHEHTDTHFDILSLYQGKDLTVTTFLFFVSSFPCLLWLCVCECVCVCVCEREGGVQGEGEREERGRGRERDRVKKSKVPG